MIPKRTLVILVVRDLIIP